MASAAAARVRRPPGRSAAMQAPMQGLSFPAAGRAAGLRLQQPAAAGAAAVAAARRAAALRGQLPGLWRRSGAFQHGGHAQHQGYADSDAEFGDGYYEDEEPRRGKRWLLIAAALVGAIGVGGALAYTYRSIVAPKSRLVANRAWRQGQGRRRGAAAGQGGRRDGASAEGRRRRRHRGSAARRRRQPGAARGQDHHHYAGRRGSCARHPRHHALYAAGGVGTAPAFGQGGDEGGAAAAKPGDVRHPSACAAARGEEDEETRP